jgi:HAE1 family hydrophobic/amphiphilic exporter-1
VKSKGYSTAFVANGVKDRLVTLRQTLPTGTRIEIVRDAGQRVEDSVRNVEETLIEGAMLTVLVVFVFLISGDRRSSRDSRFPSPSSPPSFRSGCSASR